MSEDTFVLIGLIIMGIICFIISVNQAKDADEVKQGLSDKWTTAIVLTPFYFLLLTAIVVLFSTLTGITVADIYGNWNIN